MQCIFLLYLKVQTHIPWVSADPIFQGFLFLENKTLFRSFMFALNSTPKGSNGAITALCITEENFVWDIPKTPFGANSDIYEPIRLF